MRFLVDNALSPILAQMLAENGHDAVHVRALGMATAEDMTIFAYAENNDRIVISADSDFSLLLSLSAKVRPSIILLRRPSQRPPKRQAELLTANLPQLKDALEAGCIVVFDENRIRIRMLPISGGG